MSQAIRTTHERHNVPVNLPPHPQGFMVVYRMCRTGDQLRTRIDLVRDEGDMNFTLLPVVILDIDGSLLGTG